MKRVLLTFLMVVLFTCVFAISISAAVENIDGIRYELYNNGTAAVDTTNNKQDANNTDPCTLDTIIIPNVVVGSDGNEYTVTSIDPYAFRGCPATTVVVMPKLKTLYSYTFCNMRNLKSIFIDFSEVTRIESMVFNQVDNDDGNPISGVEYWFYKLSSWKGVDATYTEEDKLYDLDLSKVDYLAESAFHNANIKKVTIGTATEKGATIGIQTFRFSELEEVVVKTPKVPSYFCGDNVKLTTVTVYGATAIGNNAFAQCTALQNMNIDMSIVQSIESHAFVMASRYDSGNTRTIWKNLNGEKIVDFSNVKTIAESSFASSNVGGNFENQVIWPKALNSLGSQAFRRANISGNAYINASEGKTLSISSYTFSGNKFNTVVFGERVVKTDNPFSDDNLSGITIVFLADTVDYTSSSLGSSRGITSATLYYNSFVTERSFNRTTMYKITSGTANNYGACGIVANVVVDGENVTLGEITHSLTSEIDNTLCPVGKVTVTVCSKCGSTEYTVDGEEVEKKEHVFALENGAVVSKIVYSDFGMMGTKVIKCAGCDACENEAEPSAPVIFEYRGISHATYKDKDGKYSVTQGFYVNSEAYARYIELGGKLEYGLVTAVKSVINSLNPLTIANDKIEAVHQKVIVAEQSSLSYDYVDIKVSGFDSINNGQELIMCLYVYDGENIYYLHNGTQALSAGTVLIDVEA